MCISPNITTSHGTASRQSSTRMLWQLLGQLLEQLLELCQPVLPALSASPGGRCAWRASLCTCALLSPARPFVYHSGCDLSTSSKSLAWTCGLVQTNSWQVQTTPCVSIQLACHPSIITQVREQASRSFPPWHGLVLDGRYIVLQQPRLLKVVPARQKYSSSTCMHMGCRPARLGGLRAARLPKWSA